MILSIKNTCEDFTSYRAERVKSLFNASTGADFSFSMEIELDWDWQIGVVVGPSGSGKTSIGKKILKCGIYDYLTGWDNSKPIIDCISPNGDFNEVTGALAGVGLGSVPSWLRPFHVLSNGEQFRVGLARLLCEKPGEVVIDEFTSVIDRQIAKIGSSAFQKSWRRGNPTGKCVLLTPHYDILDWIEPDWVIDTKDKIFHRGRLRRRPKIEFEIKQVDGSYWKYFKPHYYLDLPRPVAASYYVGLVNGELVSHVVVTPAFHVNGYRATRLIVMPEWQGAGVGTRFLDYICQYHLEGRGRKGKKFPTMFHTSHPQLCNALRRSKKWRQVSSILYGANKKRSMSSMKKSGSKVAAGYGGHMRAVQGFKYVGEGL